jgi:ABC-type bacteriocin/lantibiotic exporter with double-glycine peptidase domain
MENGTSIFMLGAFVAAAYKIIPGISKIINVGGQAKTYLFTLNELKREKMIRTPEKWSAPAEEVSSIEMRQVQFSYGENPVLKNFSCTLSKKFFYRPEG